MAVFNQTTDSMDFIQSAVDKACFPMLSSVLGVVAFVLALIGLVVCFLSSVLTGVLLMVPCALYFAWLFRRRSAFVDQVSALRDQIKGSQVAA